MNITANGTKTVQVSPGSQVSIAVSGTFSSGVVTPSYSTTEEVAATLTVQDGAPENAIVLTAKTAGVVGNDLSFTVADPGASSAASSLAYDDGEITFTAATDAGDAATVTTAMTGADNDITIDANVAGVIGDDYSIELVDPNVAGRALSVTTSDNLKYTVNLATAAVAQVETATAAGTVVSPVLQVETATVIGTIEPAGAGDALVVVTAAGMDNSPKSIAVAVANDDTASQVATKIRAALVLDADVGHVTTGFFTVTGAGEDVILTAKVAAANDATMNIRIDDDTSAGLTNAPTSADTTAGVATGSGNATVTVTSAIVTGSPLAISVPVVAGDTANDIALAIRTALTANAAVNAKFIVSGATDKVILTTRPAFVAANDTSLNIAIADGTSTGVTTAATSANTTPGDDTTITSTATSVVAALNDYAPFAALMTASVKSGDSGAGIVTALAETPLAGGGDNYAITSTYGDLIAAINAPNSVAAPHLSAAGVAEYDTETEVVALAETSLAGGTDGTFLPIVGSALSAAGTATVRNIGNSKFIGLVTTSVSGTANLTVITRSIPKV